MITEEIVTKVPEVFRDGDYWLAADGKVYREGVLVGLLDNASGKVIYEEGMHRYMNRVGRLLNKLPKGAVDSLPAVEFPPEEKGHEGPVKAESVRELILTAIMCDYPEGSPAYDWRGDMTPDFVEWYFTHFPERAKRRYETRRSIPVVAAFLSK